MPSKGESEGLNKLAEIQVEKNIWAKGRGEE